MTEEETFEALEKYFGCTVHGWPCIPRARARWWQRRDRHVDRLVDGALTAIGRAPYTPEMSALFWEQVRYGQDICEDAGGYDWRCWCAALELPFRAPTLTYSGYMAPNENAEVGRIYVGLFKDLGADKR
ncbi:hypothetical protein MA20_12865 [Bradyrhizobium japonicum]|uniref:Uncharacterized protein n=1 Tax=Bradyrhizobium japonicum TaxID=375 RepID=A0A0A3Y154_BRAJP|nr:hypothetical protein [Bradyrhizobium japonicum]KGT79304.1 hypothetical protein MA20_12865 [Bradyrhizobium japonicum]